MAVRRKKVVKKKVVARRRIGPTPKPKTSTSTSTTTSTRTEVYDDVVRPSTELTLKHPVINIHGPIGAGKTFMALSACKDKSKMLWISADNGATDGFATQGIEVPELNLISLASDEDMWRTARFNRPPSVIERLSFATKYAADRVRAGVTEWVVIDTLSSIDVSTVNYWNTVYPTDGWALYRANLQTHIQILEKLMNSGAKLCLLFHTAAVNEDDAKKKMQNQVMLVAGGAKFTLAVSGKSGALYKRHASFQIAIQKKQIPNTKRFERRAFLALDMMEGKNRFEDCLDPEEKPDIQYMIDKINKKLARERK